MPNADDAQARQAASRHAQPIDSDPSVRQMSQLDVPRRHRGDRRCRNRVVGAWQLHPILRDTDLSWPASRSN